MIGALLPSKVFAECIEFDLNGNCVLDSTDTTTAPPQTTPAATTQTCGGIPLPQNSGGYVYGCSNGVITATNTQTTAPSNSVTTQPPTSPSNNVTTQSPTSPTNSLTTQPPTSPSNSSVSSNVFYLQNPLSSKFNSVGGLVQGFLEIFSYIVVLFAVLALIWVGLKFVLAQGNPEEMKKLKDWLLWIVVGVAIVIGARIIVSVVINTLQATGTVNQNVIDNANNALNGNH